MRIDANPPAGGSKHPSFGALLRRVRTQQGLSLETIARDTRLARRYLLALEDESIDHLPGGVYNRAYVRTYAEYLHLNADSLVRDYDFQAQAQTDGGRLTAQPDAVAAMRAVAQQRESQTAGGKDRGDTPRGRIVVVRSVASVVLVGGVWAGARHFGNPSEIQPRPAASSPAVVVTDPVLIKSIAISAAGLDPVSLPEPQSFQPQISDRRDASPSVSVTVSGVGTDVIGRQLVGRSDAFAIGTRVVFWTLVTGGQPGDIVRHVWVHRSRTVAMVNLPIGGISWRTQSHRMLAPGAEGEWVVEAQDDSGHVLARHHFLCSP